MANWRIRYRSNRGLRRIIERYAPDGWRFVYWYGWGWCQWADDWRGAWLKYWRR
jgi:hypothetical protein